MSSKKVRSGYFALEMMVFNGNVFCSWRDSRRRCVDERPVVVFKNGGVYSGIVQFFEVESLDNLCQKSA